MTQDTNERSMSRRKALTRIAALALGAYAVPAITTLSMAQASSGSSGSSGSSTPSPASTPSPSTSPSVCSGPTDDDAGCSGTTTAP